MKSRPLIVYLHRYPPEYEVVHYCAMRPLCDRLLEKYDVLDVSMKGAMPLSPELRRGMRIIELPLRVNLSSGVSKLVKTALFYIYLPFTYLKIRKAQPDLIVCQESLPFIPILMSRMGVPIMIGAVSDFWWRIILGGNPLGSRIADYMERFEVRQWRRRQITVLTGTKSESDLIIQRGMDIQYVHAILTQNQPGLFFPCQANVDREKLGLTPEHWVIAIHGTIRPGKGYSQLLEWWQAIVRLHPNWHLLIIGGAGGEEWCQRLICRRRLEANVHMTGWLPTHKEVNQYLNAADCLLVIRRNSDDNQGVLPSALPHSLATGKPTVATGLAGITEIVRHGIDGFIFEPDNYNSFRSTLEYVAAHPVEAAKVGQAGMARERECFNPNVAAEKIAEVIERIISNAKSGRLPKLD
ncbi:MAG: glycosyltransferase [Kiritimatiellia bacterium]|nr:glycosyltransferase [Kiritimatiellia bacterium]